MRKIYFVLVALIASIKLSAQNPTIDNSGLTSPTVECDGSGNVTTFTNWLNSNAGATATDNCGTNGITWSHDYDAITNPFSDDCGATGSVTVTFTATDDDCGGTATTQATFTIEDTQDPTFDSAPAAMADINCDDTFPIQETLTASDNCGSATVAPSIDAYTVDNCAGYTVTYRWTATDDCGRTTETTASFNVLPDSTDPSFDANPGNLTAQCTAPAVYADYAAFVAAGGSASDNCGIDTSSFAHVGDASDNNSCPEVITRTYRIADNCGNTVDYVQTITIDDDTDPSFDANPGNLTAQCTAPAVYADYAAFVAAGGSASDNCGIDTSSYCACW